MNVDTLIKYYEIPQIFTQFVSCVENIFNLPLEIAFWTPKIIQHDHSKTEYCSLILHCSNMSRKCRMANSAGPDQTIPLGAV